MSIDHANAPAVELQDICKTIGRISVLDHLSLTLPRSQWHVIQGPNGSGKTTVLRLIAGLITPDSGSARSLGHDLRERAAREAAKISYVTQHFSLYGEITVRENLAFVAAIRAVPERKTAIARAVEDFDLRSYADEIADSLSGGVRQRLMLAAALLARPELLLLDEPTAALDSTARAALWRKLDSLREHEMTLVLTTHRHDDAEHCDTLTEMNEGRIAQHVQLS